MKFHTVIVIFNPNSTGNGKANAEAFKRELSSLDPSIDIELMPTKFAGHAEEITAERGSRAGTVIISASGDGGYNEVVNGLTESNGQAAVAVLPSGNANDHFKSVGSTNLAQDIANLNTKRIELLQISARVDGALWSRYAHSYIGFGLTPEVGLDLTERRPNAFTEKWHVLKHLFTFTHVTIRKGNEKHRLGNLVFATVDRMSKVIKLDKNADSNDGKMEVYETDYVSVRNIIKLMFASSLGGLNHSTRTKRYEFKTTKASLVQLDGEVTMIDANSDVVVTCHKDALRTIGTN